MAHPTEEELRTLGEEVLDVLVRKTVEESESLVQAREKQIEKDYGDVSNVPAESMEEGIADVEAYVREAYSFLPDSFAAFAEPKPSNFSESLEQCINAMTLLKPTIKDEGERETGSDAEDKSDWVDAETAGDFGTTVADRVGILNSQVDDWHGAAADSFHMHYMAKFNTSLQYQHDVVFGLAAALEANQKIFKAVGDDIRDIGAKTKEALEHVTDKDPTGTVVTLTVAAAVASVAAAAATGGASLLLAGVAASGSTAAGIIGATADDPVEQDIAGSTTQEIMVSWSERISDLYQFINSEEEKIVTKLQESSGAVAELKDQIEMPLPADFKGIEDGSYEDIQGDDGFYHT